VAVVEPGELERQDQQRRAGQRQQLRVLMTEDHGDRQQRDRGGEDVRRAEQPAMERLAPHPAWERPLAAVDLGEPPGGKADERLFEREVSAALVLVDRQTCCELRGHVPFRCRPSGTRRTAATAEKRPLRAGTCPARAGLTESPD